MKDRDLDRVLAEDETIIPSSGFAGSVMEAVRREALAPAPIQFPWKRAVPGLAAGLLILLVIAGEAVFYLLHGAPAADGSATWLPGLDRIVESATGSVAAWAGVALILSLVLAKLSMRLAKYRPSSVWYTT